MDEKPASATQPDDPSAEEIMAHMAESCAASPETPLPEVSSLGPKGEAKYYVQQLSAGKFFCGSSKSDEPLPEGAKEITWEQACELLIRMKVNSEYRDREEQLAQEAQRLAEVQAEQARATKRSGRKAVLWNVLGYESMRASRGFGRWIKGGR